MAYTSSDWVNRFKKVLLDKAVAEFSPKRITLDEMTTFIRYKSFVPGHDKKLVASIYKDYLEICDAKEVAKEA